MLKMFNTDNQHTEEVNFISLCPYIYLSKYIMFYNLSYFFSVVQWVYCESCEKWQHQICGLYNQQKDIDKTADYICPYCLLKERKSIENTDLGAKDLPETILSHFIERRLSRRLTEERLQTAKANGKSVDDVQEPDDLTLRVVFSADRTSHVNKTFADLLHKEHYPSEFPYRSKVRKVNHALFRFSYVSQTMLCCN